MSITTGQLPTLTGKRLILRPFDLSDAGEVQRLAGHRAIADTTSDIPHPYEDGMAEQWIATHQNQFEQGTAVTLALALRRNDRLIGAISLMNISELHKRGEIGYWVGKPYWNRGYCTEACLTILAYGFNHLGLNRIYGSFFQRNPSSGRVMEKLGMTREGILRQHEVKWGRFEDVVVYGILEPQWREMIEKKGFGTYI